MSAVIVVGSQWGDEGKGKVIDFFSSQADYVVRYQGGANAGHTIVVDGEKTVLHLVPSGVLHPGAKCVIAAGCVLDIQTVAAEIKALKKAGQLKDDKQLLISDSVSVILPYHRQLDQAREIAAGTEKIGTTGRGIGPAYEERASRKAILFGDIFDEGRLRDKLIEALKEKNFLIENFYKGRSVDLEEVMAHVRALREELEPYRCSDTALLIYRAIKDGKKVLFEGAQGTLLDLFHGTYPFVTSSSTIAGSACIGSGIGPTAIDKVIGITKAYTTRVGEGPFPSELDEENDAKLRESGIEFGATTGRPRRCGWLDLVALRYAIRINGITNLALMKLDVLSGFKKIGICTAYELNGKKLAEMPASLANFSLAKPVVEYLDGWDEDITNAKEISALPQKAKDFIKFIESETQLPLDVISVGPGRDQTLWARPLFS